MFVSQFRIKGASMKPSNIQILLLRLVLGVLFAHLSMGKIHDGWLSNAEPIRQSLTNFQKNAGGIQLYYIEHVAMPYTGFWAKLITVGEACLAISFILGLLVRLSSAAGIFMVLNLHAATGNLFSWDFFSSPWAALLVTGFLILNLARAGRWVGLDALWPNSNGMLW